MCQFLGLLLTFPYHFTALRPASWHTRTAKRPLAPQRATRRLWLIALPFYVFFVFHSPVTDRWPALGERNAPQVFHFQAHQRSTCHGFQWSLAPLRWATRHQCNIASPYLWRVRKSSRKQIKVKKKKSFWNIEKFQANPKKMFETEAIEMCWV